MLSLKPISRSRSQLVATAAMDIYGEASFNTLFRRCVRGCPDVTPTCPICLESEICSLVPPNCNACQQVICVPATSDPTRISTQPTSRSSANVGAIAGGVIGGVVVIAAVTFFVWKYCVKAKRQEYEQDTWSETQDETLTISEKDFAMGRDVRASTHTVASIASSVMTRASNIIQIAYIPGVMNRSAPSTPGLLVPPVPPIPIALSSGNTSLKYDDEHFFMPGDLRDSTYSGISDRTSFARNSVASTIYGRNAVVSSAPTQTVIRGKAAVVSVKSTGANTPGELTPPVPHVDYGKYGYDGPPSPAFSVGSTFLNSASAAMQMRPQVVRVGTGLKKSSPSGSLTDNDNQPSPNTPLDSNAITIIEDPPAVDQGSFADTDTRRRPNSHSLSAVMEEATKKNHGDIKVVSAARNGTPFGDEHETKD